MTFSILCASRYDVGQTNRPFALTGVTNALIYAVTQTDIGSDTVLEWVGTEPNGDGKSTFFLDHKSMLIIQSSFTFQHGQNKHKHFQTKSMTSPWSADDKNNIFDNNDNDNEN